MSALNKHSDLSNLLRRTLNKVSYPSATDSMESTDSAANLNSQKNAVQDRIQVPAASPVSTSVKLQLLDQALSEVEAGKNNFKERGISQERAAASKLENSGPDLPPLELSPASSSRKESEASVQSSVEQGASIQVVEAERSPELSPEVEKYLQEVHKDQGKAPGEIAISDEAANLPSDSQFVSEPVIVVPITPEVEKKGKRKSHKFSVRWLVEWSQKIVKMFAGKVIYLQPPSEEM